MSTVPDIFRLRTMRAATAPESVDEAAGVIRGASVIQAVEALGHNVMVDETTLSQITALGNAAGGAGLKVRFGHPGMCDDALGKKVGHATNFRISGDKVLADIALAESASFNPNGDLRKWLLHEAKTNPGDFGLSVVMEAQRVWKLEGGGEVATGERPKNAVGKMPFARVQKLSAVDFTEDPAANRDGVFSNADFAAAFSGTRNTQAVEAFAAIDSIRERLHLPVDAIVQFAQRYAATRSTPATGPTMKLAAAAALALALSFPDQVAEIERLASADHDEASIRAQLGAGQVTALKAKVTAVEASLGAEQAAHTATKAALAALQTKFDALSKLGGGTPPDVGGTPADKNLDGLTGEERWKAEFNSSKEIQDRFHLGGIDSYVSYMKHEGGKTAKG